MTTAYTSLLGLALPVTGELSGTWGDTVNTSITSLLDSAIAGTTTLSADTTLTTTTGASNQARQAILLCTGQVANITITAPAQSKIYTVINASATYTVKIRGAGPTTGITIPVSSTATVAWNGSDFVDASGYINGNLKVNGTLSVTGAVTLTAGTASTTTGTGTLVITGGLGVSGRINAANFDGIVGANTAAAGSFTTLTTSSTVTHNGGTANGVGYLDGSKVLTTGTALVFDGTNLGVGNAPAAWSLSGLSAVQVKDVSLVGFSNAMYLNNNVYYNGGWKFIGTGYGLQYTADRGAGAFLWNISTASGTAGNAITFTQAMTLDASGNLLVGTTGASALSAVGRGLIELNGSSDSVYSYKAGGSLVGYTLGSASEVRLASFTAIPLSFYTNNSERARIDSSGNLLVGTTSVNSVGVISVDFLGQTKQGITLDDTWASTGGVYILFRNSAGDTAGRIDHNGTTTVAYTTSSDYRLKENIAPMTGALAKVLQLNPVTYKWKSDGTDGQGFIAHELQAIVPDAVVGAKDAMNEDGSINPQGIDTSFLVATLTAAIQEQQALITTLTARITALESA